MKNVILGFAVLFGAIIFLFGATTQSITKEQTVDLRKADISIIRSIVNNSLKETQYLYKSSYTAMIFEKAKEYNVPVHLALALIDTESGFDPQATNINKNGTIDVGLMQLNSSTFHTHTRKQLFNPEINVSLGLRYLRDMYDRLGTWEDAVMAYNAGPYRVEQGAAPDRTIAYMYKIMQEERDLNSAFLGI